MTLLLVNMIKKASFLVFGIDIVLLLALGGYFLFNKLIGKPYVRGFFCDDSSISYPYKHDTISWELCLAIGGCVPLLLIVVLELILKKYFDEERFISIKQSLLLYVATFVAGFFFEHMFVEIAKFNIGRLRPNFLDVCRPYFQIGDHPFDCQNTTNPSGYVGSYECVTDDYKESLLSFPSGHTSLIVYGMVFATGYLQIRMPQVPVSFLMKPFLQLGLLLIAWYISLSRVSDNKHHWSDVLAGGLIGTITSFVALHYIQMWQKKIEKAPSAETGLVCVDAK